MTKNLTDEILLSPVGDVATASTRTRSPAQDETADVRPPQSHRRRSFLEDFDLDDLDDDSLDSDEDHQFVDIEEETPSSSSATAPSSPPHQVRRINNEADRNSANANTNEGGHAGPPRSIHSWIELNDAIVDPSTEATTTSSPNSRSNSLPRRISFECHSSAIFEGMLAGGEFADAYHSDSSDSSDSDSDTESDTEDGEHNSQRRQNDKHHRPHDSFSSPRRTSSSGASPSTTPNIIRRSASTIRLRNSSSMISLASICEDANVREAPSMVSKIDRYIINREIRLGSDIVRTQSELALHQKELELNDRNPHDQAGGTMEVTTSFTRRGRRLSRRSCASTNDLPSVTA